MDWFAQENGSGFQINFPILWILSEIIFRLKRKPLVKKQGVLLKRRYWLNLLVLSFHYPINILLSGEPPRSLIMQMWGYPAKTQTQAVIFFKNLWVSRPEKNQ